MYILTWRNPSVDPGKTSINVPVASTVANAASLTFTGKGSANYGKVQQENLMRLLENFADGTAPLYPTVGQLWYDTSDEVLKLCTATSPLNWKSLAGIQVTDVGDPVPTSPNLGDIWFERTGPLSGFLYVYTGLGRFPVSQTVNGGWHQLWPQPMEAALREEYDEMAGAVIRLISENAQGNGADGRLFQNFTLFSTLDADLNAKFAASPDSNVSRVNAGDLHAQPYSGDWDTLLSASRWALSRLDIPSTMYEDVSAIPFVQDGRMPPNHLFSSWAWNDVRFPTSQRVRGRRYGMVTMARLYAETMNVLSIAANNRYNLRGMSGNSGTNSMFGPEIAMWVHNGRIGSFTGGTGEVSTIFRWASDSDRNRFIFGGNAIEVTLQRAGATGTPADAAFASFINKHDRFRITADRVRAMVGVSPHTMTVPASNAGMKTATDNPGTFPTIGVFSEGGVTLTLQAHADTGVLYIFATLNTSSGVTGTTTVRYNVIKDCTAFGSSDTDLFPSPFPYNDANDKASTSSVFTNIGFGLPPVANFSASTLTPAAGAPVVFTWTGSGSPSLIEWDLTADGNFTTTGSSVTTSFPTAGLRYTVRVRATNAVGSDVLTRSAYILAT